MKKKGTRVMAAWANIGDTQCPVARAQGMVGDRWTVLILRELFMGSRRFEGIQAQTQATPQMLASRLKKLEEDGLVERRAYSQRPLRHDWRSTRSCSPCALGERHGASQKAKASPSVSFIGPAVVTLDWVRCASPAGKCSSAMSW